jgi:type II secretory pathway component PulM
MVHLTRRERNLAGAVALVVTVWALYAGVVAPVRDRITTLQRLIPDKRNELSAVQARSAEYVARRDAFEDLRARIAAQDPNFQLPSYLEALVEEQQLGAHVATMTPNTLQLQSDYSETIVGIELEAVTLKQLADFLAPIEASQVLASVGSLHIYRNPNDETLLNATIEIHSPRLHSSTPTTGIEARS